MGAQVKRSMVWGHREEKVGKILKIIHSLEEFQRAHRFLWFFLNVQASLPMLICMTCATYILLYIYTLEGKFEPQWTTDAGKGISNRGSNMWRSIVWMQECILEVLSSSVLLGHRGQGVEVRDVAGLILRMADVIRSWRLVLKVRACLSIPASLGSSLRLSLPSSPAPTPPTPFWRSCRRPGCWLAVDIPPW